MKPIKPMPFIEFVILLAFMFASVAYSIDSMLPLLPQMGAELAADAPQSAQLVITTFVLGLGLGTLFVGPISDAFGRKSVILTGIALYMLAATMAALSTSMELLLAARFLQGLGTAAPRVTTQALVRDLYAGRRMAQVMSFAMTIFVLVPAVAPLIGATLGGWFGWRSVFWSFLVFGTVSGLWLLLRQPETLPREKRRPLQTGPVLRAFREVFAHRQVMYYVAALTFGFASMFIWLSLISQMFDDIYDRLEHFPLWFALCAMLAAPGSLINAKLVMRLGMRRLVVLAFLGQLAVALTMIVLALIMATPPFWIFIVFLAGHFFAVGLLFGNLNALALEPLGHIAGTASSVVGGVSTMMAALIAAPIAATYNQTLFPLTLGVLFCVLCALLSMRQAQRYA